jgi:predicted transcriptional regulator
MDEGGENQELLSLTTKIVASHAGSSKLATSDLPALIGSVFEALRTAGTVEVGKPAEALVPAVPIKRSVMPEFIVCLEDGRKMKTLKRHLATRYNLTPAEYRQRWGLPNDYPMVAPAYAAQRSALAKSIGLGRKRADAAPEPEPELVAQKPTRRVTVGRKMPKTAA